MAKRGISISVKLISISTLLIIIVIGLFSFMNTMQTEKIIGGFSDRLQGKITDSLRRAGVGQLQLLSEATRIALAQSDYTTLRTMVQDVGKTDERVTAVAVIDTTGTLLGHSNPKLDGTKATDVLMSSLSSKTLTVRSGIQIDNQKSITFAAPVKLGGEQVCSVFLAYSLKTLDSELAEAQKVKKKEVRASLRNTLIVGLMTVMLGVLMAIIQGLRMTRPIQALARQADQMASGDLQARVNIRSRDEIGILGERFNFMAEQMLVLMRETMAKATMEKELEVASAIQATLVPDTKLVNLNGIKLVGYFKPATHCGGDWWNYYTVLGNKTLILIGDVTGHGVGAAMITAAAQGAVTTLLEMSGGQFVLPQLLQGMNAAIHAAAKGKFVMTCFASMFDPETRKLTFANAGHNFPYLFDAEKGKLASLVVRGNRLGDIVTSDYETKTIQVRVNDALIWYTDGIIECENIRGEEYGERRFRSVIMKHANLSPDQALSGIVDRAVEFYGEVPQKDDITLVLGKLA